MAELLSQDEIETALAHELSAWRRKGDSITRSVTADSFSAGIRLVTGVAEVAEDLDHHPDIDIRWTTITFTLSTHSAGGLTRNDLRLAGDIDRLAG
ncbi:MAG: 4a-hydroxytetrahydrobiopterin dehydratase [Actinomycetota bacterium]|jgi:4a-hydroxytetrahydrobiopterin dehydratase|nr:4a-hydroxytetrahydrobiopterin dehydratase [Actinomycetota bacterium]